MAGGGEKSNNRELWWGLGIVAAIGAFALWAA
jgi:hypothetical protein